jgi:hypothetical protein
MGTIVVSDSCTPPEVTAQPEDQSVSSGSSATLDVTASGTPPLGHQWFEGISGDSSAPVSGATASTFTTPPLVETTSYWVRVSNACGQADSATATVTVHPAGDTWDYSVAAVAHNPGLGGTTWRTDIVVLNLAAREALLTVTFRPTVGSPLVETSSVPATGLREWRNVLESGFGLAPTDTTSGGLTIASTAPLLVTSRTYNQTSAGSYGQYLPGTSSANALQPGDAGYLPLVRKDPEFRTNVGVINLGSGQATIRFTLYDPDGDQIGDPVASSLEPGEWHQVNDLVEAAGIDHLEAGYATVEVTGPEGQVWAYASVIDNATGDATTIPLGTASDP